MDDCDRVCAAANQLQISEYKLFELAASQWGRRRIHDHFVEYLLYDDVPMYVRDYVRKLDVCV
jgi:hypothetical protein